MKFLLVIFILFPCISIAEMELPTKAYTVQIYSSKDKEEAAEFGVDFHKFDKPFLWPKTIKNQTWYRVCVGLFNKKVEADELLEKIKKDYPNTDAFVSNIISE